MQGKGQSKGVLLKGMIALLILSSLATGWVWLAPYEWKPESGARFRIEGAQLKRDRSYHWLLLHLKKSGEAAHDLEKPVFLETAAGETHEPADTTFAGREEGETDEIWFRFWLEDEDFSGPLKLHLNEGSLTVRSGNGIPDSGNAGVRNFSNHRW